MGARLPASAVEEDRPCSQRPKGKLGCDSRRSQSEGAPFPKSGKSSCLAGAMPCVVGPFQMAEAVMMVMVMKTGKGRMEGAEPASGGSRGAPPALSCDGRALLGSGRMRDSAGASP